jgi:hypothetical protein
MRELWLGKSDEPQKLILSKKSSNIKHEDEKEKRAIRSPKRSYRFQSG